MAAGRKEAAGSTAEQTDAIRERVLEMFGKRDRKIAESLISDEIVTPPKARMTAEETAKWKDGVRRVVNYHRNAILAGWKEQPLPKPGDPVEARRFVARCQTRIEELDDIVDSRATKSTARANAYAEIRHLETLIAQTLRVDTGGRRKSEDEVDPTAPQSKLPFVGVLMDWRNVDPETRAEIERERKPSGKPDRASASVPSGRRESSEVPAKRKRASSSDLH